MLMETSYRDIEFDANHHANPFLAGFHRALLR